MTATTEKVVAIKDAFDPVDVAAVRYIDVEDKSSDDEAFLDELDGDVSSDEEEDMNDETGDLITTKKTSAENKDDVHARIVQSEDYIKIKNTFHEKLSAITVKYGTSSEVAHESTDEEIQNKEPTIGVEDENDTVTNDIASGDKYALVIADGHEILEDVKTSHMQQTWMIAEAGTESEWLSDGEPYRRKLDGKNSWVINIVEKALIKKKLEKKQALEAKGMDVAVWNQIMDEATIEELQELYTDFNVKDGASDITPVTPQAGGGASAEPKDKKRILPEKIAEVGEYTCEG